MALAMPKPDPVEPEDWCQLILNRCGLAFRDSQIPAVVATVREQLHTSGAASERQYYEFLAAETDGGAAWLRLLEQLVNHETSFFRHPPSYEAVRTHILPELREARGPVGRLNLWSAGCATGQEAYSLAMVASDSGDDRKLRTDFTVWGGDISRQAIEFARRGRYGPRAVAGISEEYRRRFLQPAADGTSDYEIVDALRRHVRFTSMNLTAAWGVSLNYDVIFCHNVLIYMSPPTVSRVVRQLASRLALGGYLLLGPGEAPAQRPPALEALVVNGVRVLRRRTVLPEARS